MEESPQCLTATWGLCFAFILHLCFTLGRENWFSNYREWSQSVHRQRRVWRQIHRRDQTHLQGTKSCTNGLGRNWSTRFKDSSKGSGRSINSKRINRLYIFHLWNTTYTFNSSHGLWMVKCQPAYVCHFLVFILNIRSDITTWSLMTWERSLTRVWKEAKK